MQGRFGIGPIMEGGLLLFMGIFLVACWEGTVAVPSKESTQLPKTSGEKLIPTYKGLHSGSNTLLDSDDNTFEISNSKVSKHSNGSHKLFGSKRKLIISPEQSQARSLSNYPFERNTTRHHSRHNHSEIPIWLSGHVNNSDYDYLKDSARNRKTEDSIAAVFRDVAYGKGWTNLITRRYTHSGNRYERTTVLSDTPDYNYIADDNPLPLSGQRNIFSSESESDLVERNVNYEDDVNAKSESSDLSDTEVSTIDAEKNIVNSDIDEVFNFDWSEKAKYSTEPASQDVSYNDEIGGAFEESLSDSSNMDISKLSKRGNSLVANITDHIISQTGNGTNDTINKLPILQVSWYDYLICANRNMAWIFINFILGVILIIVGIFAPYRLMTLRLCTHILPRTHFVCVHLLIFIAVSLKALYMFHLAFGGKERLPLILILILTDSSVPCFISVYLILILMMFLTADVQVYKPKFLTMHNVSVFIVMMIALSFISDIIVGSAHSKSVLILSRAMLIIIAVAVIVFYIRKHPKVIHVINLLKREFQGELKLLVAPSKDSPQQKQVNIKYILRNRLHSWCRVMTLATTVLGLSCLFHFVHAVFLISSHVPVWVWWSIHVCGAVAEAVVGVLFCIAAALTQRYDEKSTFVKEFFVPPILLKNKRQVSSKERNGNVVYQRVSYSSGTESTQYTTCPNEGLPTETTAVSRTPKAPRRRTATVRRSATFSYAPQYPRTPGRPCQPPVPNLNVMRAGSTSQIPMYRPGSLSRVSEIYSPASVSHVPVYTPNSARSMLVHEDGFIRIRTQIDPRETQHRRSGSYGGINDSRQGYLGSNPQIHHSSMQQWNGYGSRESFYHCLPRRRRSSRSASFHHHNPPVPETDYSLAMPHRPSLERVNIIDQRNERTLDPNYHSFSRRQPKSRETSLKVLNNVEDDVVEQNRRPSSRVLNMQPLNNLDRPDEDYQSLGRRKLSHDDNNDPVYYNSSHEGSFQKLPTYRNNSQYSKVSPMNVSDRQNVSPSTHYSESPSTRHKISNVPAVSPSRSINSQSPGFSSPGSPNTNSPGTSKREAHFPKPFSHRGSNSSLRSEDILYLEHYQRTNPVRRNHSSAGYFPSRYLENAESLTDDTQRYGSLRIGRMKKRQPGYVLHTNTSKLLNKYLDKYPRPASEEGIEPNPGNTYGIPNKASRTSDGSNENAIAEGGDSGSDRTQSAHNTSRGSDQDWALDVITSSSMLTDFYSLKRPKKKRENIEEE